MRRLSCTVFILLVLLGVVGVALAQEDPLACLEDRGNGAADYRLTPRGRWYLASTGSVPILAGDKGVWNGYSDEAGWSYSFGWPDDMRPVRTTTLYRDDHPVGYLWFYDSPSAPSLHVLFVYRSMIPSADDRGEHMGEHDFCWWGTLR